MPAWGYQVGQTAGGKPGSAERHSLEALLPGLLVLPLVFQLEQQSKSSSFCGRVRLRAGGDRAVSAQSWLGELSAGRCSEGQSRPRAVVESSTRTAFAAAGRQPDACP